MAYSESAAFLCILGGFKASSRAREISFLLDEQFPDGFQKFTSAINTAPMLFKIMTIQWSSNCGFVIGIESKSKALLWTFYMKEL